MNSRKYIKSISVISLVLLNLLYFPAVYAASLTSLSDTMTRLDGGTASNHTIKFTTPTGVAAGQTITLTFPSGFGIGSTAFGDIDMSSGVSTGAETEATLAATPSGTTWGAAFAGQVLTITSGTGTISAGHKVIIEIGTNATSGVNQITNHATAATYLISIGGSMSDTGRVAVVILDNDQVSVTATVDPSITFSLSATSTAFGTLAPSVIDTADTDIVLTVGTNGNSGYSITVQDIGSGSNPGLYNSGASTLVGSADGTYHHDANLTLATEGYGLQISCTAGCAAGDIAADWKVGGETVGGLTIAPKNVVTYTSSTSANHTLSVVHKAKVSASTKAGIYTDTLTYIATGNF